MFYEFFTQNKTARQCTVRKKKCKRHTRRPRERRICIHNISFGRKKKKKRTHWAIWRCLERHSAADGHYTRDGLHFHIFYLKHGDKYAKKNIEFISLDFRLAGNRSADSSGENEPSALLIKLKVALSSDFFFSFLLPLIYAIYVSISIFTWTSP